MEDIAAIRAQIPCLDHFSYLNMSYGPKPNAVTEEVIRLIGLTGTQGISNPEVQDELWGMYEKAREGVAKLLGANTTEISLTRHVSEGMNIVATGFDWSPGDEVIISNEEHPAGSLPWMNLALRRGIKVRLLKMSYDLDDLISQLDSLINQRTKIVSLSHVSTKSGFLMPAKEITDFVHQKGIPIVFDGAHATGLVPVNVKNIGCDFYTSCGHKWILAPQGTGFLYVNESCQDDLQITWLGAATAIKWDLDNLRFETKTNADKFEYGTRDLTVYGGLAIALDQVESHGIENISSRSTQLATRMKKKVMDMKSFELMTPDSETLSTGIVSLIDRRNKIQNPTERLFENHKIMIAGLDEWTRISLPYFTLEEEVDRLAEVIEEV